MKRKIQMIKYLLLFTLGVYVGRRYKAEKKKLATREEKRYVIPIIHKDDSSSRVYH